MTEILAKLHNEICRVHTVSEMFATHFKSHNDSLQDLQILGPTLIGTPKATDGPEKTRSIDRVCALHSVALSPKLQQTVASLTFSTLSKSFFKAVSLYICTKL